MNWFLFRLLILSALTLEAASLSATLIPVKHREGTTYGFIVLRSQEGQDVATGDLIQTVEGEKVTSQMTFHFKDGSLYDEVTVFSQKKEFRLISDHLRQEGKSFPETLDFRMDVASGNIEVTTEKNGKRKSEHHHLKIPEDVADGLLTTLVKNISPSDPEITVSLVSESSSPRVVKLKIHAEGEHAFSASGRIVEGTHFVIHTDIGGVAGVVAPVIGKQPVDLHFWIMEGKAPAFLKFTGQLFDGGPVWNIEKAVIRWENAR